MASIAASVTQRRRASWRQSGNSTGRRWRSRANPRRSSHPVTAPSASRPPTCFHADLHAASRHRSRPQRSARQPRSVNEMPKWPIRKACAACPSAGDGRSGARSRTSLSHAGSEGTKPISAATLSSTRRTARPLYVQQDPKTSPLASESGSNQPGPVVMTTATTITASRR